MASMIIDDMQHSLEMAGGSVGFTALFLAGVIGLWYGKFEKKPERVFLFWYALVTLVTVINPIYIKVVRGALPELYFNNYYLWILPSIPVIIYSCSSAVRRLKNTRMKIFFVLALLALLVLAATTSYSQSSMSILSTVEANDKRDGVIEYISLALDDDNKNRCLIWGEPEIMERARQIDGRICTLYGKDRWQSDGYDDKVFDEYDLAYETMKTAPIMQDKVASLAIKYGCDYIIIMKSNFDNVEMEVPDSIGTYVLEYSDGMYLIYKYEGLKNINSMDGAVR